jgi:outer membrane exchange protein TraA
VIPATGDTIWTAHLLCAPGTTSDGCAFPGSGTHLSTGDPPYFASRYRGFISIPTNLTAGPFHIGFRTKTMVGMRIFDQTGVLYELISRAPPPGQGDFRVTNSISFSKPGLYPVEIVHANAASSAVLEMYALMSNPGYPDIDDVSSAGRILPLDRFNLTTQTLFFQTTAGTIPFGGHPGECEQCPRKYANRIGQPTNICPEGMFCNEAAVCAPCVGDQFCGDHCINCLASPNTV